MRYSYFSPNINGNPNVTKIVQAVYIGKYFAIVNSTDFISFPLNPTLYKSIIIKMRLPKINRFDPNTAVLFGVNPNSPSLYKMADNAIKSTIRVTIVKIKSVNSLNLCLLFTDVSETENTIIAITPKSIRLKTIKKSRSL